MPRSKKISHSLSTAGLPPQVQAGEMLRQALLTQLWRHERLTETELRRLISPTLPDLGDKTFDRLFAEIVERLMAAKAIEQVTKGRRKYLRIAYRLDG
ncbi:MAG: hypothetical protein NZM08_09710 [Chitinophagales bacterium]|nr:hypothetical protein [Chitinophagales bacterium]